VTAPTARPQILSTADFESAVSDLDPRIAVFDCDGTLWSGDAGSAFMHWTIQTGLLSKAAAAWLGSRYQAYLRGEVSELAICGEMVQVYQGLSDDDMRDSATEFFHRRMDPNIFPEMQRLIATLQEDNVDIWAVSSTCHWVIEEGVKRFDLSPARVLAARVAIANGIVTDRLLDVPTDEGKVAALARAGIPEPDAVFGNSIHDAAMLAIARRAFPVNPTKALVERSAAAGWPIYYPASMRPV
jgi:phosphoserine phosphatase